MPTLVHTIRSIHTFSINHLLYPLVLSSLLAGAIFAGRVYLSRELTFYFLLWNLFLAWIPYVISLAISFVHRRHPRLWWLYLLLPGLLWLIFLPNAPYIVTDLWHLDERRPVPLWYDIGMFATFAWTGCFLGIISLNQMQHIVRQLFGRAVSWLFALSTIGLCATGIYLGRFGNWNSWDLFFRPQSVLSDAIARFAQPIRSSQALGMTLLFAAFLLVCYVTLVSIERRKVEVRGWE